MTALDALKELKKFLEKEVANEIELQKENSIPAEYVNPSVAIVTLPHKNFVPVNFQVPNILVGLNRGQKQYDEHAIDIRIACAVYGGDVQFGEEYLPDEKGYIDLLNLIEKIIHKLIQHPVIREGGLIEHDFTYGIYDEELTYPYWYGYIEFTMQLPNDNRQMWEFGADTPNSQLTNLSDYL